MKNKDIRPSFLMSSMASSSLALHHPLHPSILVFFMLLRFATSQTGISLGSTLTPNGQKTSWVSPSGEFAFGFLPLKTNSSLFMLGIWYNKIPDKTMVWWAKVKDPVKSTSLLKLTLEGKLVLSDNIGMVLWSSDTQYSGVSHGAMQDVGNLVLMGSTNVVLWQSFQHPTDTMLPSQELSLAGELVSRLQEDDYTDGRFKVSIDEEGILKLHLISLKTKEKYTYYWSSPSSNGTKLVFDKSGKNVSMVLSYGGSSIITEDPNFAHSTYERATLDPDGVFRQYAYLANTGGEPEWSVVSQIPSDMCRALMTYVGSGSCGHNAYCVLDEKQRPTCLCPPRYSFVDPARKYKGCAPDFFLPTCAIDDAKKNIHYDVIRLQDVDWPLHDFEHSFPVTEEICKQDCIDDCYCACAIFRDGECWKKHSPLSNGRFDTERGGIALLKVSNVNTTTTITYSSSNCNMTNSINQVISAENDKKKWLVVGSALVGSSILVFLLTAGVLFFFYPRYYKNLQQQQQHNSLDNDNISESRLRCFTYKELEKATDGFKIEVGKGGFGVVYKGKLPVDSKTSIAVKVLNTFKERCVKDFEAEVTSIGQTHHRNLVRLLGYCKEDDHRLLVYEFMSNGPLTNFIFGTSKLAWKKRTQIAYDIAKGLLYLHEDCNTQIIHCDIKPENVLLDDSLNARISDFGMAKLLMADQTGTFTVIRGTKGYLAPEWFKNAAVTKKVDVYSFGVVFLEIICCVKNLNMECAYNYYKVGRLSLLVEDDEAAMANLEDFEKCVMVALWCVQEDPALRPSMKEVTQMLEGGLDVSVPPNPSISAGSSFH